MAAPAASDAVAISTIMTARLVLRAPRMADCNGWAALAGVSVARFDTDAIPTLYRRDVQTPSNTGKRP
jgi:hypothetical protein